MADTTTTSGNIYNLKSSTIDRMGTLSDALQTQFDEDRVTLTDIGQTIGEEIQDFSDVRSFNQETEDLYKDYEESVLQADNAQAFSDDINSINDRAGSILTQQNHDELRTVLDDLKQENLDAYLQNDKAAIQTAEGQFTKYQQDILGWLEVGEAVTSIPFSAGMTSDEQFVIGEISGGRGQLTTNAEGSLVMSVTMPDKLGDDGEVVEKGKTIKVTKTQFDNIVAENAAPTDFIANQNQRNISFMESGQSGEGTWDGERVMQDNFNAITSADSPRLSQLLRERDIVSNTGAAVKDMLGEHPALQALQIPVNAATKAYDTTGPDGTADGVLTIDDFKASDFETLCQLLENPKQLISLGLNPDLGYTLVADMMTRQNLKNWQQGTTAQESNNEQAGIEIASTDTPEASSTGVTAADLINDTINQPTNMRETGSVAPTTIPTGSSDRPQGTFVERQVPLMPQEQELRDATVRRDAPIITPREDVIAKLKDTVYSGTQSSRKGSGSVIQQLKKQFERQARSMGMSEVDIDNLFSSGDAIITKSPDGKYTVRLRTDADENLPKQTPSGKAV